MNGANGTRPCKKGHYSPVYYGEASGLKIVKNFRRVGNGWNSPKARPKKTSALDSSGEASSFDEPSLTSFEEETTPAPRLPKDNPVIKAGPQLFGDTADSTKANSREHWNTLASQPKASKDLFRDQNSQSTFGDALLDVTFPRLYLGPQGDILALRCDYACQEHSESENSPLPGAHLWCRAHQQYHCSGISSEPCDLVVLCAISVEVYTRMRVDRHWQWVRQGEKEDQHDRMEIPSDEDMEKLRHGLIATQSSGNAPVGSITDPNIDTNGTSQNSPMAMDVDEMEKPEDENPKKRVRFSDQDEVFPHRSTSTSISP
ncbi:hypothetical protein BKA64DRAFT_751489 [Cadophora sp. MPI-SDFR-AT-0126]|nr:hypothetical protein BKA64DRAFT_751489 [Leotiomycetes sp. MPI-SDFR-AT-0126]